MFDVSTLRAWFEFLVHICCTNRKGSIKNKQFNSYLFFLNLAHCSPWHSTGGSGYGGCSYCRRHWAYGHSYCWWHRSHGWNWAPQSSCSSGGVGLLDISFERRNSRTKDKTDSQSFKEYQSLRNYISPGSCITQTCRLQTRLQTENGAKVKYLSAEKYNLGKQLPANHGAGANWFDLIIGFVCSLSKIVLHQ